MEYRTRNKLQTWEYLLGKYIGRTGEVAQSAVQEQK